MFTNLLTYLHYFRLLTVAPEVWEISTIQKFIPLLDNYVRDTLVNEYVTPMVNSYLLGKIIDTKGSWCFIIIITQI